ncbi:hypothetical protein BO78DRAFT_398460 [Aspergillus sclerotiicarbonarius CBS 121057]|uniref:Uncharacterized protein n=1 Tax=Aspergillus sclerotiicarbonarius (strain CBS 121057 / IBT 28362) TaxID=1448318 RepID=A0A319E4R9_ASPSB|nr:hypothetical protein BO78DRAFT_398460 [Aspergillus sclerotiicarbonarius CBS 121057]
MTRKPTRDNDPYEYMAGFGNRFQSEVIPGATFRSVFRRYHVLGLYGTKACQL